MSQFVDSTPTQKKTSSQELNEDQATALYRKTISAFKTTVEPEKASFAQLYQEANGSEKCMLYSGWLFAAISGSLLPCMFFFLGPVFDSFTESTTPEEMAKTIREICIIMGALAVGVFFTSFFQNWLLMKASAGIGAKIKTKYLKAVLNQDSAWYDQNNYLEMSSRISKEVSAIQEGIGRKYGVVLYSYCMCLAGFTTGLYKGWSLALAMLGIAPIMLVGMGCFGSVMQKRTVESMKAYGQSAGYAEQALSAIRIVVSFGQEDLEIKNYNHFTERCTEAGHKAALMTGASIGFFNFTIYLCYAYAFMIGAVWIDKPYWNHAEDRDYMGGDVIGVFFGVLIGLFSLGGAGPAINAINIAKANGKMVYALIDRKVPIDQDDINSVVHEIKGEIEFRNVEFYYPTRTDSLVMKEFSHKFEVGKTTAIVGPSGSGKSTCIQLVERFYDPTAGEILIDGKPLKGINLRNYRQQIGYVGQEPVMFNMSIKDNILMGKPTASDKEIEEALKAVNAWDFVSKYTNGINEHVGAGGGQLSGGQKQRIALARAFIKKPKMLIFDEATSALDKANEAVVVAAIEALKVNLGAVTTLVIAHRLSTVRSADNIIVMKKGVIAEQGTHEQLVALNGIYAKLNAQDEAASKKEQDKVAASPNVSAQHIDDPDLIAQIDPRLLAAAKDKKAGGRRVSAMPTIDIEATGEVDPEAKAKMLQAQKLLKVENEHLNEDLNDLIDPKKQATAFNQNIKDYTSPHVGKVFIGVLCTTVFAIISPGYGYFIMKTMNELNAGYADRVRVSNGLTPVEEDMTVLDRALPWCGIMAAGALVIFISKGIAGVLLMKVSENLTGGVRKDLYRSIIRKDIGWHDNRENSAGIMTGTLASDVQLLNGVSSEGLGAKVEGAVAALAGMIGAFVLSWPLALCTIGLLPVFVIGGAIQQKADQENMMNMEAAEGSDDMEQSDDVKSSQLLCSDSISNYKTVASFGNDQILLNQYERINTRQAESDSKSAKCYAISLSLSVAVNNGSFAILYIAMAELYAEWPKYEYTQFDTMMLAMFVFIFGSFTAAQSAAMAPDIVKATKAASKIFKIIRTPSKIDTGKAKEQLIKKFVYVELETEGKKEGQPKLDDAGNKIIGNGTDTNKQWAQSVIYETQPSQAVSDHGFSGKIEFKDVWFRYPARLQSWVFKGLNLTIEANENIAVVGESGQGKSTFIALVMRFYDPEFGEVLIDGVNIRTMDVTQLRKKLGLVQQEPMLFNYTLRENILYGRLDASNSEILEAATKANALEFIRNTETDLTQAFSDDPVELLAAFIQHKEIMLKQIQDALEKERNTTEVGKTEQQKPADNPEDQKAQDEIACMKKYDEIIKGMTALVKKKEDEGKFEEIVDLVDTRAKTDPSLLSLELDKGFDVFAGNRGSKLSGGQKQRIAIARAIIRQPGILLLDEATSALDEESQLLVQTALYEIMGNRTSIVVAHRLTTVEKCSRLAVIDDGKIVEEGKFSELMNKEGGCFSNLAGGMKKAQSKADKRASLLIASK